VEQVERLAAVEQRLEAIGASRAEERVVALLKNLGFSEKFRSRAVKVRSINQSSVRRTDDDDKPV
jgi:hypothetical protein